ncbi:hypothetical protein [Herbaspirillum seropedicae]|uniref:hypothetical protein n=1 Tax=Herbaspirillum seropedicae TaxID=964 RepID=UPI003D966316
MAVEPESAGAGEAGVVGAAGVAGATGVVAESAGALAGGLAAGVAGASSRLLQPARTAVNTAAAKRVWRICIFCLQRLLIGFAENHGVAEIRHCSNRIIPALLVPHCQKMAHLDVSHRRQSDTKDKDFSRKNPYHRQL